MQRSRFASSVFASFLVGFVVAAATGVLVGCSKKEDATQLAPAASALAVSSSDAVTGAWHFNVDPKSTTHIDMPGIKEHIKGDTTAAQGKLDIVPKDLTQSRGLVEVDLTTFATNTFGNGDDATQTGHARTWLEVEVGGKVNPDMRYADFAIRSIDGASATDLSKVEAVKDPQGQAEDIRTVTMTVHGELLIHGHKVAKDGLVDVAFRYPAGAPADARPSRITIKSKQPLRVVLKELDVRPRDPAGQLLDWTTRLISKVAETADVIVDLGAVPAPAMKM
jgi:hypothetical protein